MITGFLVDPTLSFISLLSDPPPQNIYCWFRSIISMGKSDQNKLLIYCRSLKIAFKEYAAIVLSNLNNYYIQSALKSYYNNQIMD